MIHRIASWVFPFRSFVISIVRCTSLRSLALFSFPSLSSLSCRMDMDDSTCQGLVDHYRNLPSHPMVFPFRYPLDIRPVVSHEELSDIEIHLPTGAFYNLTNSTPETYISPNLGMGWTMLYCVSAKDEKRNERKTMRIKEWQEGSDTMKEKRYERGGKKIETRVKHWIHRKGCTSGNDPWPTTPYNKIPSLPRTYVERKERGHRWSG